LRKQIEMRFVSLKPRVLLSYKIAPGLPE